MSDPVEILNKYWGFSSFRPLQRDIIDSVLSGHDTLGLMPTGGGKSITFQVPGMVLEGLTLVFTPLVSLMKDQVDNLKSRHIKAVAFHAGMSGKETRKAWERLVNNRAKFLYIAPERLKNARFLSELKNLPVRLIVVDEAHCISQWGYDFRPDYLKIREVRKFFPNVPVLALTATATPEVADDICNQLEFKEAHNRFKVSFSRNNISYIVRPSESKYNELFHILTRTSGSSIVYVRSRRRTREIAEYLTLSGISATFYHAGLDYDIKVERQNDWRENKVRVMVATNAFGMGIDKPDVRVVIHYDLPPSLEEYYQEAGRAGRDGLPSFAVLLPSERDKATLRRRVTMAFPEREIIRRVYELICVFIGKTEGEGYESINDFDFDKFCAVFKLQPATVKASIRLLMQAGYITYEEETEHSSRVIMTVEREELYSLRGLSKEAETVLGKLLRLYTGLFMDYVMIRESRLAMETGLDEQTIYKSLLELSKARVIDFIPRRKSPFIYLPTAVEQAKYIQIGKAIYEDRKMVFIRRVESMINYAFDSDSCRVDRMLRYFGEEKSCDCDKCDVCRNRKKSKKDIPLSDSIMSALLSYIVSHPGGVSIANIDRDFMPHAEEAMKALRFLLGEGYIKVEGDRYFPNT